MSHLPRAICVGCQVEMATSRQGVAVEMLLRTGRPYYQIFADEVACPKCGHKTLVGFASHPYANHFEADYAKHEPDMRAEFSS